MRGQTGQAQRDEESVGQCKSERRTIAQMPGTVGAARGRGRKVFVDPALTELGKSGRAMLPLLPSGGAQPPPDPTVQGFQHRRRLAVAEIALPPVNSRAK